MSDEYREALAFRNDTRDYEAKKRKTKPRKRLATRKEVQDHLSNHCDIEMSELEREVNAERELE